MYRENNNGPRTDPCGTFTEESTKSDFVPLLNQQGSVLSPSSFIHNASSHKPVHPLDKMIKFADDTYLVIPSSNSNSLQLELDSLSE